MSEKSAEIYDHQVDMLFSGTTDAMRRSLLKPLVKYKKKSKQMKILELGCGAGSFTRFLAMTFPEAKIVAQDVSQPYLKVAQKKLKKYNNVSFINGLAEDLDFKSESFDAVVSVFLFHELPLEVRKAVLRESYRVLKPGGFLGLLDSIQKDDIPELQWSIDRFPKVFHEPFYKNYVQNDMGEILTDEFGVDSVNTSYHFMSKCVHFEKSL